MEDYYRTIPRHDRLAMIATIAIQRRSATGKTQASFPGIEQKIVSSIENLAKAKDGHRLLDRKSQKYNVKPEDLRRYGQQLGLPEPELQALDWLYADDISELDASTWNTACGILANSLRLNEGGANKIADVHLGYVKRSTGIPQLSQYQNLEANPGQRLIVTAHPSTLFKPKRHTNELMQEYSSFNVREDEVSKVEEILEGRTEHHFRGLELYGERAIHPIEKLASYVTRQADETNVQRAERVEHVKSLIAAMIKFPKLHVGLSTYPIQMELGIKPQWGVVLRGVPLGLKRNPIFGVNQIVFRDQVVSWCFFCEFEHLWNSKEVDHDKKSVIERLEGLCRS